MPFGGFNFLKSIFYYKAIVSVNFSGVVRRKKYYILLTPSFVSNKTSNQRSSLEEMEILGSPPGSKITFLLPPILSVSTIFTKNLKNPWVEGKMNRR